LLFVFFTTGVLLCCRLRGGGDTPHNTYLGS
jgi:hypothetical protein